MKLKLLVLRLPYLLLFMAEDSRKPGEPTEKSLIAVACKAVARLCDKDPELVKPDEDGDVCFAGDSAVIIVSAESDVPALVFQTYLLENVPESPALYALINDINADIRIGQLSYDQDSSQIRYYYCYPTSDPSIDMACLILNQMITNADLYDDRLKTRLGGDRYIEVDEDEVEV